jgi:hypothetical protein
MKEKLKDLRERSGKLLSVAGKVIIIFASMVVGFYANELYVAKTSQTNKEPEIRRVPSVKSHHETSVAINERGEIIVINRKDGSYEIYSDSVGLMIFNHYASKMYLKAQQ